MYCLLVVNGMFAAFNTSGIVYTKTMGDVGIFRIAWVYIEVMYVGDHQRK